MSTVFISHSKRDSNLVIRIKQILINVGHTSVLEEFIPESNKKPIPYDEIRTQVSDSDVVFLFLTDNVVATEYTKNWVLFEVGIASSMKKPLYIFERQGVPVQYPIPYFTDYMLFDQNSIDSLLEIQTIAKTHVGKAPVGTASGVIGGAAVGAIAGPAGALVGAILGGLIGYGADTNSSPNIQTIICPYKTCKISFRYHSTRITKFMCPACRHEIIMQS